MAEHLTTDQVRDLLAEDHVRARPFEVLQSVARFVAAATDDDARDAVIRLLEHREALSPYETIVSTLVRHVGLFPYAEPSALSAGDQIAFEAHRPVGGQVEEIVFHSAQAYAYRLMLDGRNLILSASTSFGKSLIIDAMLASGRFANCVVIVPTIALLDETRRRLVRFQDFKLITHPSQRPADRNLFVMTQERFLEFPDPPKIDFFVIDEFYKLDLSMDPDRASLLNQAFYRLVKDGGQFYLLGPSIDRLPPNLNLEAHFFQTAFRTVALDTVRIRPEPSEREALLQLCEQLVEPTIIYCRSPARAREVAGWLLDAGLGMERVDHQALAAWVADSYHPNWLVARGLGQGIAVHHGRVPRALAHTMVRVFNDGALRFLVCTSTLIEGVNTAAKNVIVFDNQVARRQFDFFTFNNIRGRSGRMSRHFVGRVFLFHDEPVDQLPYVDVPVLTQGEGTPAELLVHIDAEDLTPRSVERLAPYMDNPTLPIEVLRANGGIDLDAQLTVASQIYESYRRWHPLLSWTRYPRYEQLAETCNLLWQLAGRRRSGVRSSAQLAFLTNRLSRLDGDVKSLIEAQMRGDVDPDDVVEDTLEFVRQWPGHHLPKLLLALDRIQRHVFRERQLQPGDYRFFASRAEHLFLPRYAASMEEYGVPARTAAAIPGLLDGAESLDEVLERLRRLNPDTLPIAPFERVLIRDAQRGIGLPGG